MEVKLSTKPIQVINSSYSISGECQPIGNFGVWINDATNDYVKIINAEIVPLMAGTPIGQINTPEVYIPKTEIELIIIGDFSPKEAQLLPKELKLNVFFDSFALNGVFHGGAESKPVDIFIVGGPFFPCTNADIVTIRPVMQEISGLAEIAYINRDRVRLHFPV